MKSQVAPYKRRMMCMRVECANGDIVRLAEHPFDIKISGQTYYAGYDFTGIEFGSTFTPSSIDLRSFIGFAGATEAKLMAGVFDNARVYVFATDWNNPVVDYEPITKGIFGKVSLDDNKYTVEWMTLIDLTNQAVGYSFSTQCPHEFGGQEPGGCLVDAAALRVTGAISAIGDEQTLFSDSMMVVDSNGAGLPGYFGGGKLWITSGLNVGIPPKTVQTSEEQEFRIYEPFPYPVEVGDTYMLEPGCGKYLGACVNFDNVINRLGFDFVPGESILKTIGDK